MGWGRHPWAGVPCTFARAVVVRGGVDHRRRRACAAAVVPPWRSTFRWRHRKPRTNLTPLWVAWLMGRLGFEPRTLGLKVPCSDQLS
jgi:hypothetical protein